MLIAHGNAPFVLAVAAGVIDNLTATGIYSETLERIYGVCKHNICHIHGIREINYEEQKRKDMVSIGKDYSKLIIGYEEKLLNLKEHNLLYNDENIRNAIHIAKTGLIKDTNQNIFHEKEFFEDIEKADIQ